MTQVTGTVDKMAENKAAYNICVDDTWYGYGWKTDGKPICKEGDNVTFDFIVNGKYNNMTKGSMTVNAGGSTAKPSTGGSSRSDVQLAIQYQASRNAAVELTGILLANGSVSIPTKKGEQYDAVVAIVDNLTAKFHTDVDNVVEAGGLTPEGFGAPEGEYQQ